MKLKLTGISSFTSPLIANAVLQRGEEVVVEDGAGEKLLALGGTTLNDNVPFVFFTKVDDSSPEEVEEEGKGQSEESGGKAVATAAVNPTKGKVKVTQRKA